MIYVIIILFKKIKINKKVRVTFNNIFLIFALQYRKYNKWFTAKTNLSIQNKVVKLEWQQSFPNSTVTEFRIKTDNTIYFPVSLCEIEFFNNANVCFRINLRHTKQNRIIKESR